MWHFDQKFYNAGRLNKNKKLTMMGKAKQMLSLDIWFTIQLPKTKIVLIVIYFIPNQTDQVGSFNCRINRTPCDDRSEKRETDITG